MTTSNRGPEADQLATPLGSGLILLGANGSRRLLGALRAARELARRDEVRLHPDWLRLLAMAEVAVEQADRFAGEILAETVEVPPVPKTTDSRPAQPPSWVDPIGVAEAASLLRCSEQWIRACCRRGKFASAQRRSGCWWLERTEVLARATEHRASTSTGDKRAS